MQEQLSPVLVPAGRHAGKVAVVTGASRGIGYAIAQRLVAEGASVVMTARSRDGLQEAALALPSDRVRLVDGRAQDPEHRAGAIRTAVEELGGLDILVANAGINPVYGPLLELDPDAARKVLEVNVLGTLGWVQEACAAGLGSRPGASILTMSSVTGAVPSPGIGWYGVSKAAVSHLTVTLATELAPHIRVNALAPAVVKTGFARALYEGKEGEVASRYPMHRLGTPDDVAAAAAFVCSEDASWITGQVLTLDGGLLAGGGVA